MLHMCICLKCPCSLKIANVYLRTRHKILPLHCVVRILFFLVRECWTRDNVIKWKDFPHYWPFVRGIHRSPVNSPHKGQWRGALIFSLLCASINSWVNNRKVGDLWRHIKDRHVEYLLNIAFGRIIASGNKPIPEPMLTQIYPQVVLHSHSDLKDNHNLMMMGWQLYGNLISYRTTQQHCSLEWNMRWYNLRHPI